ncbi:hypothetical protein [Aquabacterium sp.]|uniref:hypothetical protein n=1 Tax=Aquabacterium sp. TaxID=1872578 RepID=UPI002C75A7D6|nr:hypothetical protein [Aquabacterium sp.]HSW07775.1 hypothetical protein [Aquabacterium sp.]
MFAGRHRSALGLALSLATLLACSPAIDWREMQPEGAHLRMAMPCRPASHQRSVALAGAPVAMTLLACQIEGGTFAVAFAELDDPARVGPALVALIEAARSNVRGQAVTLSPAQVRGMTPQPAAQQWRMNGTLPDGRAVVSQGVVFAHGMRVYQATVVGERPGDDAVRNFLDALAVQP